MKWMLGTVEIHKRDFRVISKAADYGVRERRQWTARAMSLIWAFEKAKLTMGCLRDARNRITYGDRSVGRNLIGR